jgi:hypothetical protein
MKLSVIINVDSIAIGQLLIKSFSWEIECHVSVPQPFTTFKKRYDSIRKDVLYNILTKFGKPETFVTVIHSFIHSLIYYSSFVPNYWHKTCQ